MGKLGITLGVDLIIILITDPIFISLNIYI
jgi:hypothetical protein